jgi:2-aminoadipate transaminase
VPTSVAELFSRDSHQIGESESILHDLPNEQEHTISLAYGDADPSHFPVAALVAGVEHILASNPDAILNYAPSSAQLHEFVATRLERRGATINRSQLMLSHGSGHILALVPHIMVDVGDTIIVEGPSFLGAVEFFAHTGAKIETIPVTTHGMDLDILEATLKRLRGAGIRPKFIYAIPTFQNPTGRLMPDAERRRLVALAATYEVLLIDDDAYGDLHFDGSHAPSLLTYPGSEWVLHIGTFSKILAPGVRTAWAYGPDAVMRRLRQWKSDGPNGPFMTHLVAQVSADGWLDRHIATLNQTYAHKYQVMQAAIDAHFPADVITTKVEGGFFVYGYLPADLPARALIDVAIRHGASFLPGTTCYANGQGTHEMRLAFSYQSVANITTGIARIGAAMRELRAIS